jgi:hypothetical protein
MNKVFAVVVVLAMAFGFSVAGYASTNKPLENLGSGLNDAFYSKVEVPDSIDQTKSKGTPLNDKCTDKTKDDVGRGIARSVQGVWKILTFWYPEKG